MWFESKKKMKVNEKWSEYNLKVNFINIKYFIFYFIFFFLFKISHHSAQNTSLSIQATDYLK